MTSAGVAETHHEGAVAKDHALQHNGAYYSGAAFHGGNHIHYHADGSSIPRSYASASSAAPQRNKPFHVVQVAIEIAHYLQCAEQAAEVLSKSSAKSGEELEKACAKVRQSQVSFDSLAAENGGTRDVRDLAKAATPGLKAADGLAAVLDDATTRSAKGTRHRFLAKSKPIPGLEKFTRQIAGAQKELLKQVYSIVRQASSMPSIRDAFDDRRYGLATLLKSVEQSDSTTSTLLAPFQACIERLQTGTNEDAYRNAVVTLERLQQQGERLLNRFVLLDGLKYEGIHYRRGKVDDAHPSTYSWMFPSDPSKDADVPPHEPRVHFAEWLESPESTGIYWITGKAGSGKSTLVKYVSNNGQTREILTRGSYLGRKVCISSHYFWYQGSRLQKSYDGLLRAILYDICRQCPDVIDQISPAQNLPLSWPPMQSQHFWEASNLQDCILRLPDCVDPDTGREIGFCVFVDGLDEYDGDVGQMLQLLQGLASAKNVAICVSSRPWEVFQQAFATSAEEDHALILHQHTTADIALVVQSTLQTHWSNEQDRLPDIDKLVEEVVKKAEGVFLWVRLVLLREVIPGLRYADDMTKLRHRISKLPPGLFEYFQHIFDRINTDYREETARLFLACQRALKPLPLPAFGVIVNDDPVDVALSAPLDDNYNWNSRSFVKTVRAQVNGRCQDLLAVEPSSQTHPPHHIEFLHRSVKEFLEEHRIHAELVARAGKGFESDTALFASYVLLSKMAHASSSLGSHTVFEWSDLALYHAAYMTTPAPFDLLVHLDQAMSIVRGPLRQSSPGLVGDEGSDFLRHLISAGVVSAVQTCLLRTPRSLSTKKGRPHLDFALRHDHPFRPMVVPPDDAVLVRRRVAMVELLLEFGADLTQRIYDEDNRTVWDLYLAHLYRSKIPREEAQGVVWACITAGVRDQGKCEISGSTEFPMSKILENLFGTAEGQKMCDAIRKNEPSGALNAAWAWLKRNPLRDIG